MPNVNTTNSKILVLITSTPDDTELNIADLQVLSAAKQISELSFNTNNPKDTRDLDANIDVFLIGHNLAKNAEILANLEIINNVFITEYSDLKQRRAEHTGNIIVDFIKSQNHEQQYTHVIANTSSIWKSMLPRIAALLDVMQISDITSVISTDTFTRTMHTGNAIATVQSTDYIKIISVRTTLFKPIELNNTNQHSAPKNIEKIVNLEAKPDEKKLSNHIKNYKNNNSSEDLTTAKLVVSGGRGFDNKSTFNKLLIPLAKKLNAAVGASRAAVDSGFCTNDCQVGQSGKTVAPDFYLAIGISGAIQHLCGMRDSKTIIAINRDNYAPIFQSADYWLIGDLNVIIPELISELEK